jgi:hypothetical protein
VAATLCWRDHTVPMVEAKDRASRPILDAEGNPTFNTVPVGDVDRFMKVASSPSSRFLVLF